MKYWPSYARPSPEPERDDMGRTREDRNRLHLHSLCAQGAREVRAGRYDGVRFYLYNWIEADIVRAEMAAKYPDVKFACDVMFSRPPESEKPTP